MVSVDNGSDVHPGALRPYDSRLRVCECHVSVSNECTGQSRMLRRFDRSKISSSDLMLPADGSAYNAVCGIVTESHVQTVL